MPTIALHRGDCAVVLRDFPDASVDAVVTDPPYGLSAQPDMAEVLRHWLAGDDYAHGGSGFMGKSWDSFVPGPAVWREVFRVLKPGGHAVVFAGTRTADLMGISLRLGGFEIRDMLSWLYGSGFPKSQNISKMIDKMEGAERPVIGRRTDRGATAVHDIRGGNLVGTEGRNDLDLSAITGPATLAAAHWDGWGTALKPACEPIWLARKPLVGTTVANVLAHGTGAIHIEACRIGTTKRVPGSLSRHEAREDGVYEGNRDGSWGNEIGGAGSGHDPNTGRWPANVILTHHVDCVEMGSLVRAGDQRPAEALGGSRPGGFAAVGADSGDGKPGGPVYAHETVEVWECHPDCPVAILDGQSGIRKSGSKVKGTEDSATGDHGIYGAFARVESVPFEDTGGASRFFYAAKASKAERSAGLPDGERSPHPTVKPLALMRYLVKLITPPGGVVLDHFVGSGSTMVAAGLEGFDGIGIDRDDDETYLPVAKARCEDAGHGVVWAEGRNDSP